MIEAERQSFVANRVQALQHAVKADTSVPLVFARDKKLDIFSRRDLKSLKRNGIKALCKDLASVGEPDVGDIITNRLDDIST